MAKGFDYLMMHTKIGGHRKVRKMSPDERWAYIAGAVALAAESPIRGALLIEEDVPATAEDIAEQATVKVSVAKSMLTQATRLKLIVEDPELKCLVVSNFDEHNPAPKADPTAADRMRRYRARRKDGPDSDAPRNGGPVGDAPRDGGGRNDDRNGDAPEVEEEGEVTATRGEIVTRDHLGPRSGITVLRGAIG